MNNITFGELYKILKDPTISLGDKYLISKFDVEYRCVKDNVVFKNLKSYRDFSYEEICALSEVNPFVSYITKEEYDLFELITEKEYYVSDLETYEITIIETQEKHIISYNNKYNSYSTFDFERAKEHNKLYYVAGGEFGSSICILDNKLGRHLVEVRNFDDGTYRVDKKLNVDVAFAALKKQYKSSFGIMSRRIDGLNYLDLL